MLFISMPPVCWKIRNQNYLLLNCIDKLSWMAEFGASSGSGVSSRRVSSSSSAAAAASLSVRSMFPRLILDAPDVPTWFFADTVTRCISTHGAKVLHLFNHLDKAVEAGRLRRAITGVYPGNGLVLPTTWPLMDAEGAGGEGNDDGHLEAVSCDGARESLVHHDCK